MPAKSTLLRFCFGLTLALLLAAQAEAFGPFPEDTTVFVDITNLAGGDGSAEDPFGNIQEAVDSASPGDIVGVAPGSYREAISLVPGVVLRGHGAEDTVLEPPDAEAAVLLADDSTLAGFRITGGTHRGWVVHAEQVTNVILEDNHFIENDAIAFDAYRSNGIIRRNKIVANPEFTGFPTYCPCDGLSLRNSAFTIADNEIDGTDSNGNLDAIYVTNLDLTMTEGFVIERNLILGKISLDSIDAMTDLGNVVRDNVIISTDGYTSGISVAWSPQAGRIVNNTLTGGFGIFTQGDTVVTIENNIVAFGKYGISDAGASAVIRHNNVFGNWWADFLSTDLTGVDGNISVDPLFVDKSIRDFRLMPDSPCIDAGDTSTDGVSTLDFAGDPRILDGNDDGVADVDMGAFEAPLPVRPGEIDVRPGHDPNVVTLHSPGPLAVALLGSEMLNVQTVAPESLAFGPSGAAPLQDLERPLVFFLSLRDVNWDGELDLLLWFNVQSTGLAMEDTEACLEWTSEGKPYLGCDDIIVQTHACGLGLELVLLLPPLAWLHRRRRGRRA